MKLEEAPEAYDTFLNKARRVYQGGAYALRGRRRRVASRAFRARCQG